jgi:sugar phosphate isomerase/epimerase
MKMNLSRRNLLTNTALAACGFAAAGPAAAEQPPVASLAPRLPASFRFCLNMATIRGQKLGLVKEIETAGAAGYDAVEPWIGTIDEYVKSGGSLKDMAKRIKDLGMTMESAIGFAEWIVDDDAKRARGLENAKRDMDMVAQLGGKRIAAPPAGATNQADLDLRKAGERYRKLCEVGDATGITPMVEVWGFSKCLNKLSDSMFVALDAGHPRACLLPDIYHLHKGGSAFVSMNQLSPGCVQILHMNDYPADPPRERIKDADRIYPGDGVAPITETLRGMLRNHSTAILSLELFNPDYWKQDALEVAKTGLAKMKASVAKVLA